MSNSTQTSNPKMNDLLKFPAPTPKPVKTLTGPIYGQTATITAEYGFVSPDKARTLLAANVGNRAARAHKIAHYERVLRDGKWRPTTDAVGVSATGRLINGQHRLQAIVNTGIGAELLVVSGLPDQSQLAIDRGLKRSTADALMFSFGDERFASIAGRVAKTLLPLIFFASKEGFTDEDVADHVRDWGPTYDWLARTQVAKDRISAPVLAALAYAYAVRPEQTDLFARKMATPSDLPTGHPVLAAIRIAQEPASSRDSRKRMLLRILRCIQMTCEGQTVESSKQVYAVGTGLHFFQNLHERGGE